MHLYAYRAASVLSLGKDVHNNMLITVSAVVITVTRLSITFQSDVRMHPRSDSSHDPFEAQYETRVYPPLLYGA